MERHKALHALCEICHKIGIEVRSGQLTFELAMVDFRSYFIYAGVLVYLYGDLRTEERVFSYLCFCRSVHVEPVSGSVRIVAANRAVVTKVYIPKYFLIIILLFQNLFKMAISFGIVIVMMMWSHVPVSYNVIYVIPIFVDLILITFGVSAILAHFGVFFDDLKNITNVGLRILFYMSGIFYVITDRVNEAIATLLLKVNPVGFLIDACRSALVYCETPHRKLILLWFVIGAALSAIGVAIIYKNENNYVKVI